uniref:Uncharacterized protein n=1 Tax=Arundo donax TaxID=35708 RepID=A0A0A9EKT0_ARUDO
MKHEKQFYGTLKQEYQATLRLSRRYLALICGLYLFTDYFFWQ